MYLRAKQAQWFPILLGRYVDGEHTIFSVTFWKTDSNSIQEVLVMALGFAHENHIY